MIDMEAYLAGCGLEHSLIELVKTPRLADQRLRLLPPHAHPGRPRRAARPRNASYLLNGWRRSSLYNERERAALAWTEALTLVAQTGAPDADYEGLFPHFSETEGGGPDHADRDHQRLEPPGRGLPQPAPPDVEGGAA